MDKKTNVWAFDLGKGSIGEAVRCGNTIKHKESLLIPADFAETKTAAKRRRMARTRQAHKAREDWLKQAMEDAGIQPLIGRRTEKINGKWQAAPETVEQRSNREHLEREFARPGDDTCYTSSLLRIKLIRGDGLEPWQIYKALHSAIQRRGYDPDIPWKGKEARKATKTAANDDDDAGTAARMHAFEKELEAMAPGKPAFHFPCYFDAWKMGLWNPEEPDQLKPRIDCRAQSTRNQIMPRRLVEKEVRALIDAAAIRYPSLQGKADYVLYGPAGEPYASHNPTLRKKFSLREGGASDWQGVLGQKIPRFDNRIVEKCILVPRMNVCKVDVRQGKDGKPVPESLLASEVTFLMKLKNMQFQRCGIPTRLTATEIKQVWDNPKRKKLSFTEGEWKKLCLTLSATPLPGFEKVDAPKLTGRSRFCRPALAILKRLILSGQAPADAHVSEVLRLNGNQNPARGLVEKDLNFLLQMGQAWDGLFIPNQKLDALVMSSADHAEAIRTLIGSQNDPIVRHRLSVFAHRLNVLAEEFGVPDHIALEFVREDFMGEKAKSALMKFQRDRAKERAQAKKEAEEAGATERAAGLKMELLRAQGGICLYTGEGLIPEELDDYDIDHIVPRNKGGPDAAVNYVLTRRKTNSDEKTDRTPFEWLSTTPGWDAYVNRVRTRIRTLRNKKVQLLISPNAEELVQKYTALAETAWISKLAQTLISLRFGWNKGNDQGTRRITVVSGGLTGRIRRQYNLNSILNPCAKDQEEAEKKNRDDDRHHALDAMVISFIPNWARDPNKQGFFRFPDDIQKNAKNFFAKEIESVVPRNICFEQPRLAETIYGVRTHGKTLVTVQRVEVKSLAYKPLAPGKSQFDLGYARKQIGNVRDLWIQREIASFLEKAPDESSWGGFCAALSLKQNNGMAGSPVNLVRVNVGQADEYADLSKDGTGAYRKALKGHKGQIVFLNPEGKARVRPVYVFESVEACRKEIARQSLRIVGFFQSGCLVELEGHVAHPTTPLAPGKYKLNTIFTDRRAKLSDSSGKQSLPISLDKLLAAKFRRIEV